MKTYLFTTIITLLFSNIYPLPTEFVATSVQNSNSIGEIPVIIFGKNGVRFKNINANLNNYIYFKMLDAKSTFLEYYKVGKMIFLLSGNSSVPGENTYHIFI